ncbi:tetratricopeptide repeat protein [Massilia cavernae]|uniref:Tetratricopeptide repeat protein n=1 Tax=Massilia cavernae TaxID=2320864 RepID=A0A418XUM1_9BURK|nr:tetratricopeptide repeat protein [Massilia cavernae]RJG16278.1 tetratricopeptide repeat protein [Massilia cavernae]
MNKLLHPLAAAALALSASAGAQAANYCGELKNHFGPLDYRMRGQVNLEIVEDAHFTPDVEAGIKGSTGEIGADLDYTLRAIPNHPRALATMAKVGQRLRTTKVPFAKFPVECYFNRAIRFAPDDGVVRATYGNYLFTMGKTDEALKMFTTAVELLPKDPTANYNLGLLYLKKKDYANARRHAMVAYDQDFPLPGLKNKLVAAGEWDKPAQ